MKPIDWIIQGETGISSKTIWYVMMGGTEPNNKWFGGVPGDSSDFGRCYKLLALFPEWRARMPEVATINPEWTALVRHWDELTALYEQDDLSNFYGLVRQCIEEGKVVARRLTK